MNNRLVTTVALVAAAVLLGGASYYVTDVRQAAELHTLQNARQVAAMNVRRVDSLQVVEVSNSAAASGALDRWHARYKYIPGALNTADIVEYLESLTQGGFEQFDLKLAGNVQGRDFSTYTFEVEGMGTYHALYQLVWHLENNREFYRINNLFIEEMRVIDSTPGGEQTERDMARFTFSLGVYYAGLPGISAPADSLLPIPEGILPPYVPDRDIFRPLVRVPREDPNAAVDATAEGADGTPPGADTPATPAAPTLPQGLDVEAARLVFILGNRAFFDDARGRHIVEVGDPVEGGEIVQIDANGGTVRARISQGGSVRMVVRTLGSGGRPGSDGPS
jgi:hypothetical protein